MLCLLSQIDCHQAFLPFVHSSTHRFSFFFCFHRCMLTIRCMCGQHLCKEAHSDEVTTEKERPCKDDTEQEICDWRCRILLFFSLSASGSVKRACLFCDSLIQDIYCRHTQVKWHKNHLPLFRWIDPFFIKIYVAVIWTLVLCAAVVWWPVCYEQLWISPFLGLGCPVCSR